MIENHQDYLDLVELENALPDITDNKVFHKARLGLAVDLENILTDLTENRRKEIIEKTYLDNENDQVCSPLVIAARNGHFEVVKTLITKVRL